MAAKEGDSTDAVVDFVTQRTKRTDQEADSTAQIVKVLETVNSFTSPPRLNNNFTVA